MSILGSWNYYLNKREYFRQLFHKLKTSDNVFVKYQSWAQEEVLLKRVGLPHWDLWVYING